MTMNNKLIDTIKEMEISKTPETKSLEEANQSYTKKQLAHFIERFDLDIAKSWKKDEIVAPLSDWMKEASVEVLNSDAELHSFYMEKVVNAEEPFDVYSDNLSETDLECALFLIEHGLAYNVDGQLWVPEETEKSVSNDIESDNQNTSSKEEPSEVKEEVKTESKPNKKKLTQTSSSNLSTKETLAQKKQTRLKYLKKMAKKKKK